MFNPSIYRSYDIRGVVPNEFDAEEGYHIARAYAQYLKPKKIVVARDMRPSGDEIEPQVIKGLTDAGVDVISIGQVTSPMFYFAVHYFGADGGLMVTASHNPGKYNGIKLTREEAIPIGGNSGLLEIRDLVEKRDWEEEPETGTVEKQKITEQYLNWVTQKVDATELTLVVDAGNGMAGSILEEYFNRVGGNVIPMYWEPDGTFPNHEADPLKEENMADLMKATPQHNAHIGVAFDGDGDRVFFCTEKGERIPGEITTALIAQEILREQPGATMLYDLRSSRATKEVVEEAGGKASMSKVGHSNIKKQMREERAVFAGEVSGHLYFTPYYAESSFMALGYLLRLLKREGKPLSEIIAPLMRYAKSPEINFEVENGKEVLEQMKQKYADAEILELDGVSIIYPTWWANVRASNTEPVLRLNMEADTPELLQEKQAELEQLIGGTKL